MGKMNFYQLITLTDKFCLSIKSDTLIYFIPLKLRTSVHKRHHKASEKINHSPRRYILDYYPEYTRNA